MDWLDDLLEIYLSILVVPSFDWRFVHKYSRNCHVLNFRRMYSGIMRAAVEIIVGVYEATAFCLVTKYSKIN